MANNDLPFVYGVWLTGKGWLRGRGNRVFTDMRLRYAEDALSMCRPAKGRIVVFDDSMLDLESYFLEQEKLRLAKVTV